MTENGVTSARLALKFAYKEMSMRRIRIRHPFGPGKTTLKRSPLEPDSNHLHQLVFYSLKKKNSLKLLQANLLSANLINSYNLIIFLISMNYINNTQIQVILILLNLIIYTVIYFKLFVYRYKRL